MPDHTSVPVCSSMGVGRPDSDDRPLIDHVLAPFGEPREDVLLLIERAADLADE